MIRCAVVLCYLLLRYVLSEPLVRTNVGWIRGLEASDGDYSMFLGIPYAKVDDDNPFGRSSPYPEFDGIFEADDDSAICPQMENNVPVGTLDCLHLNIYVPESGSLVSRNRLPVLVWIYGGAFNGGYAGRHLYGPRFLVRHDVILVTLNYRVGTYGFMCLEIPEVPGNQGLKDQQLALRWIKENIYWFGGDPDNITLFGESAGGVSVNFHLLSEEELFHRVILQSGTILNAEVLRDPHPTAPLRMAEILGYETNDVYEALSVLSKLETNSVVAAGSQIGVVFRPCVEKAFDNVEHFLTDYPINLDVPRVKDMPVMVGSNNHELLVSYVIAAPEAFETMNPFYTRLRASFDFDEAKFNRYERVLRQFYIGDENISQDVKWDLVHFDSDIAYIYPAHRSVKHFLNNGADKIYYYMFAYGSGERNFVKSRWNITVGGAAHADEISYLFDVSYMTEEPTRADQLVIDRMTTMWTNFAKYGDPTPETTTLLPVKWIPIKADTPYYYMDIDAQLNLWTKPYHQRMKFLDLFFTVNEKYQKGYRERNN